MDLIDFQTCSDGEFKWLLVYQDHFTKFVQLRPLKPKAAIQVANSLRDIFSIIGNQQFYKAIMAGNLETRQLLHYGKR